MKKKIHIVHSHKVMKIVKNKQIYLKYDHITMLSASFFFCCSVSVSIFTFFISSYSIAFSTRLTTFNLNRLSLSTLTHRLLSAVHHIIPNPSIFIWITRYNFLSSGTLLKADNPYLTTLPSLASVNHILTTVISSTSRLNLLASTTQSSILQRISTSS